jgi:hypothetical protein
LDRSTIEEEEEEEEMTTILKKKIFSNVKIIYLCIEYNFGLMIYMLTAIGLTPSGSSETFYYGKSSLPECNFILLCNYLFNIM